jgi:hypothetical protein
MNQSLRGFGKADRKWAVRRVLMVAIALLGTSAGAGCEKTVREAGGKMPLAALHSTAAALMADPMNLPAMN